MAARKKATVRRAELLHIVKQAAPLDRTPMNREQRRQAERYLRRIAKQGHAKRG